MNSPLVLVIEDEPPVQRFLKTGLETQHYQVKQATTAKEGETMAIQYVPDAILLDLGLPDRDGIEVVRSIRAWSHIPIIVLSARGLERHKVEALDAGADDYLTKPFGFPELLARIRAAIRRNARPESGPEFELRGLRIDFEARRVTINGSEIHLTPTEYKLLSVLVRHAGKVVTHKQLLEAVWGPKSASQQPHIRVYMAHLRRKLEEGGEHWFSTEVGVGYRFTIE